MAKDRALRMVDEEVTTVLESDAEFEGKLTFEGVVQINGKFRGEIFSNGLLIVGEGGEVDANIDVGGVIISGTVRGTVLAKQKIEMLPPARVFGDINSPALVVSEGAVYEGRCSMGQPKVIENEPAEVFAFNNEQEESSY